MSTCNVVGDARSGFEWAVSDNASGLSAALSRLSQPELTSSLLRRLCCSYQRDYLFACSSLGFLCGALEYVQTLDLSLPQLPQPQRNCPALSRCHKVVETSVVILMLCGVRRFGATARQNVGMMELNAGAGTCYLQPSRSAGERELEFSYTSWLSVHIWGSCLWSLKLYRSMKLPPLVIILGNILGWICYSSDVNLLDTNQQPTAFSLSDITRML